LCFSGFNLCCSYCHHHIDSHVSVVRAIKSLGWNSIKGSIIRSWIFLIRSWLIYSWSACLSLLFASWFNFSLSHAFIFFIYRKWPSRQSVSNLCLKEKSTSQHQEVHIPAVRRFTNQEGKMHYKALKKKHHHNSWMVISVECICTSASHGLIELESVPRHRYPRTTFRMLMQMPSRCSVTWLPRNVSCP
jgi:hypothetical protein